MPKTQFARIATEGDTVDSRKIERSHLEQMAADYNPATYTARVNLEHLRGFSPEKPFNAYGSVIALKTEEFELELGGKKEKRLGLYAQIEANQQLVDLIKADQKVFTSIEIAENFAGTKRAYLGGLALTDSPASLATERLKFSKAAMYGALVSQAIETSLVYLPDTVTETEQQARTAFSAMGEFFKAFTPKAPDPTPAAPVVVTPPVAANPAQPDQFAAFGQQIMTGMKSLADAMELSFRSTNEAIASIKADQEKLRGELDAQPSGNHFTRQPSSGGGDKPRQRAEC